MTEEIGQNVAITFSNIRRVAIGLDFGNPCEWWIALVAPNFLTGRLSCVFRAPHATDART